MAAAPPSEPTISRASESRHPPDSTADDTLEEAPLLLPSEPVRGEAVAASGSGFLQAVDADALADWAAEHGVEVALRIRPGAYVPRGVAAATVSAAVGDARDALDRAFTFGPRQAALQDL